jgi:hypothetical protein
VVDARHSGYGSAVFYDEAHLDRDGAAALSAGLARIIARSNHESRWQALPRYQSENAVAEDLSASHLAVVTSGARLRR